MPYCRDKEQQSKKYPVPARFPRFSAMYSDLMRTLAGLNYSAIACNQRGYSLHSPSSENDYLYTTLASDALNVARKHFGDTKFHLVGHDHGAFLGWVIAAANTNHLLLSYLRFC